MELTLNTLLPHATAFGLALLHSLWIGVLLYCSVRALLPLMAGPRGRHHLAYGALLLLGGAFGLSYYLSYDAAPVCNELAINALAFNGDSALPLALAATPELSWTEWFQYHLPEIAPWLSLAYWLGLLPATLLLLRDQERVWDMRRSGLSPVPADWAEKFGREIAGHSVTRRVRCFLSEQAGEVMTLGFWSPIVVFPVALVNELTPEMARTILLHELAHLRHYDHLLNYPQQLLKTFFFYHPAAYALCQLIDREREHRCDDFVAGRCADRRTYATALVTVARTSHIPPNNLVMSATKTHFSTRIQRLFLGEDRQRDGRFAFSVFLFVLLGSAQYGLYQTGADAGAGDCLGESKVAEVALTPEPTPSPATSCWNPNQMLTTWTQDAPQPPASDNVRAWAAYERAVERYERVHVKVAAAAQKAVRKLREPRHHAASHPRVVQPIPSRTHEHVKTPCPQAAALRQARVSTVRPDSVPPVKTVKIKLPTEQQELAFFLDGQRVEPFSQNDVDPADITAVNVIKGAQLSEYSLEAYDGAIFITTKNGTARMHGGQRASLADQTNEDKTLKFDQRKNNVFLVDGRRMSWKKVRKISVDKIKRMDVFEGKFQAEKLGYPRKDGVVKIYLKG